MRTNFGDMQMLELGVDYLRIKPHAPAFCSPLLRTHERLQWSIVKTRPFTPCPIEVPSIIKKGKYGNPSCIRPPDNSQGVACGREFWDLSLVHIVTAFTGEIKHESHKVTFSFHTNTLSLSLTRDFGVVWDKGGKLLHRIARGTERSPPKTWRRSWKMNRIESSTRIC